jgi:hypothetical protein
VPSTHDQMIECDWTCARYASEPRFRVPKPSPTAQRAPLKGARSQPIRNGLAREIRVHLLTVVPV